MDKFPTKVVAKITVHSLWSKTHRVTTRHTYLLLIIPLLIIAYTILGPGIIIGGDFPVLDTGRYASDKLSIWLEKGGVALFEGISRFPITGLWYILNIIGIDASIASKLMILMGFALASFSFYFSFLLFFRGKLISGVLSKDNFSLKLGAIIGALFFAYNVWSFHRIAHWHLWIGYSVIPLFFVSTYLSFKNPKEWRYILCSLFLWSFASSTPHMTVFYGIIFAGMFLFFVFYNLASKKRIQIQIQILLPFVSVLVLYALVNLYWIYPYILGSDVRSVSPDYVVVRETIEALSRDSSFLNTFRIVADWLGSLEWYKFEPGSFSDSLWRVATFAIPIFAFLSLILSRRLLKYTLVFAGIALLGIVIAMGTNSFYDYYELLFGIPALSNYIWIFRDPDKWSFLITFAYSFLIGIGGYTVLHNIKNTRKLGHRKKAVFCSLFMFLLVGSICVYSFPVYSSHILNRYKPIPLPLELDALNDYLAKAESEKVYFMPYPLVETYWKNDAQVGRIYQMHSIKPSIESTEPATKNYYNFLIDSIMENRSKGIDDLIYPMGTSYLIFHNDTWNKNQNHSNLEDKQLLDHIYSLEGIRNLDDIGFYHIFKVGNNTSKQINLFEQNVIAIGGLEVLDTLNAMQDFSAINSSIAFVDDVSSRGMREYVEGSHAIVTKKTSVDDLIFSFIDDKYIVSPFNVARNYDPFKTWSKVGATDPLHGEFHPLLERLGIDNREFDFGKGLVMTGSLGANITIPVEVPENHEYSLVMRLLENNRGGMLNVYTDGKLTDTIDTKNSDFSDEFIWKGISDHSLYLEKGRHTITLENLNGLNAVNVIGIVPTDSMNKLVQRVNQIIQTKQIIYLLEGESNFFNKKGRDMNSVHYIFNNNNKSHFNNSSISGQFRTPGNSDLVSLAVSKKNMTNTESAPNISNITIYPAKGRINLLGMDFERKQGDVSLALLRDSEWMNHDEDALNLSREMISPISDNSSLRVDVNPVNGIGWSIISTDFVPINDDRFYELSMDVRGKDVDGFHVRIQYYDSNKTRIDREIIYDSNTADSVDDKFAASIIPPKSSGFLKIEILVAPEKYGTYIIDNVNFDEVIPNRSLELALDDTQNKAMKSMNPSNAISKTPVYDMKTETDSITVDENHLYNYTANTTKKDVDSLIGLTFKSSEDVTENSTRYRSEASSGRVLSMDAHSEVYSDVDLTKSANYTIALRAKTCEMCGLTMIIDRVEGDGNIIEPAIRTANVSLANPDNSSSGLEWIYLNNTYLLKGKYRIGIESTSQIDLDLVTLYSENDYRAPSLQDTKNVHNLQQGIPPAYLTNYNKLSPTEYTLEIKNATRPYVLTLAESYDPLWTAYTNEIQDPANRKGNDDYEFRTNSIPLYSIINGFHINKSGSYLLTIKYEPQDWFFSGATVSALVVISLLMTVIFYYLFRKMKILGYVTGRLRKTSFRSLNMK